MASDSAEVAEDYRHALEDLSSNMRFEISNLTVIARENTEHALAIAEVLQQHILKTGPSKKLPALYVLDSIVKNVGTPYTLYFGRNLFKIFMESYAVVDHNVRKKMEDMLRTWKDPVPGSMDTRPVFSHELVRPIENALMKVKGVVTQQQGQMMGRPHGAIMPHRNTPTPPQMRGSAGPPGSYPMQNPYAQATPRPEQQYYGQQQHQHQHQQSSQLYQDPHQQARQSTPQSHAPYHSAHHASQNQISLYGRTQPGTSVEVLNTDIQNLIAAAKAEFSRNPSDSSVQARLKGLLDLQAVLQLQSLPPDQLELIRNKVNELATVTFKNQSIVGPGYGQAPPIHISTATPPPPSAQTYHAAGGIGGAAHPSGGGGAPPPSQPYANSVTPQPASQVTLDSLFGQGAMAALLARKSSTTPQGSSTPQQQNAMAFRPPSAQPDPPKPATASQTAASAPSALLDQLRQAGLIGSSSIPSSGAASSLPNALGTGTDPTSRSSLPPSQQQPPASTPVVPANIASLLASARQAGLGQASPAPPVAFPGLDTASLKSALKPEAVANLYENLGPPCTQCGRRFKGDEEGRRKKVAHMDWHFRVHQRSTEAEKRGMHRSWYVDAADWLASREVPDSDHTSSPENNDASPTKSDSVRQPKYIPIPDPTKGINNVCPICQEKFENKWLDTAQEWVWLDAVLVGNRAYHASCHDEATRDREGTPSYGSAAVGLRRTPEPTTQLLGKRKAESGGVGSPTTMRSLKSWA